MLLSDQVETGTVVTLRRERVSSSLIVVDGKEEGLRILRLIIVNRTLVCS